MGVWKGLWMALEDRDRLREAEKDRDFQREMFKTKLLEERRSALLPALLERRKVDDQSGSEHYLRTLKALGASDEVIAKVGGYGAKALEEAVDLVKKEQERYAGTPLDFGPANIDALLSSAVTTTTESGTPDWNAAMAIYGLDEESLEEELAPGISYRDALATALTSPPKTQTTFIQPSMGAPLTPTEITTIQDSAQKNLTDTLMNEKRVLSEDVRILSEKMSEGTQLTEDEIERQNALNERLLAVSRAEEALKAGAPGLAIELVGGQAIMPYLANNPVALEGYSFATAWNNSIRNYTFTSEEEVRQAAKEGRVKAGDLIILNGKVGTLR